MAEVSRNKRNALVCTALIWVVLVVILAITTRRVELLPLVGFATLILFPARRRR